MADIYGEKFAVYEYGNKSRKENFILDKIIPSQDREDVDDGFVVFDIGDVIAKQKRWCDLLPRVKPFYAVKCRPYPVILSVMNALRVNFDCASKTDLESVLQLGVDPTRIIFSHTRKQRSTLAYAHKNGVDLVNFDDEHELMKIKDICPSARLLLRFAMDDPEALYKLGSKFGCQQTDAVKLLQTAKLLQLNVVGIHFHIGSSNRTSSTFKDAIAYAYQLFQAGNELGFHFTVLDIGGGFPGDRLSTGIFKKYAEAVNSALDEYFPESSQVEIIAEPGAYYTQSALTIVTNVIGKRRRVVDEETTQYDYYLDESLYKSFTGFIFETNNFRPLTLQKKCSKSDNSTEYGGPEHNKYNGTLYGSTGCGTDVIMKNCLLQELDQGDWIYFEDLGHYSYLVTNFNGFKRPFCYYALPKNCRYLRPFIEKSIETSEGAIPSIPEDSFQLTRDDEV